MSHLTNLNAKLRDREMNHIVMKDNEVDNM